MAISLNATNDQGIQWATPTAPAVVSILMWVNFTSLANDPDLFSTNNAHGTGATMYYGFMFSSQLNFLSDRATNGSWHGNPTVSTGLNHLAITYDSSSTSNDPLMYISGSSVAVTKDISPSGAQGTVAGIWIGNVVDSFALNGIIHSFCVYNRILSAIEIADAKNSKLAIPSMSGLVFAPQLWQSGTITDFVAGSTGTPSGSPVFLADTVLTFNGIT